MRNRESDDVGFVMLSDVALRDFQWGQIYLKNLLLVKQVDDSPTIH